jgi:RND family efflux transporter MFP subunit
MNAQQLILKHKKPLIILAIVIFAVTGLFFGVNAFSKKQQPPELTPLVKTITVKIVGSEQSAKYSGEVRGRYESQLAFQVSGKLVRRNVELGSKVHIGDVLMEIDPKDIQQTVNISSAQVLSAQSQLKLAENNLKRYQTLFKQGAVSQAVYEQYENAHSAALAAARMASAQYSQGSNQLGYTELRAVNNGVISNISAESGQVVAAGQAVLTLVQDGEREIEISVPENRHEEIAKARDINVSFWALPEKTTPGQVREISPMADPITRTYKVRITLINPPSELKLGMTASVSTTLDKAAGYAPIPLSAIYQTGDKPHVWIVQNDTVSLRPVRLGAFGDSSIQVVDGLKDQEIIVTAGVHKLKEGQKIRLAGDSK